MKYASVAVALSTVLAACGHGHDDHTPQEPIKVEDQSPYRSPMNEQTGVPFAIPFAYEAPIDPVQLKYLNVGVARAIAEYKMVGEILKTDLARRNGRRGGRLDQERRDALHRIYRRNVRESERLELLSIQRDVHGLGIWQLGACERHRWH